MRTHILDQHVKEALNRQTTSVATGRQKRAPLRFTLRPSSLPLFESAILFLRMQLATLECVHYHTLLFRNAFQHFSSSVENSARRRALAKEFENVRMYELICIYFMIDYDNGHERFVALHRSDGRLLPLPRDDE